MRDNGSDAGTGGGTKGLVPLPYLNSTQLTMAAERKGQIPTEGKTAVKCLYCHDNATKYLSQYILFYSILF